MEKFDFNYQIKDWEQRKKLVDEYIINNKILEKIEELTIKNTVPRKKDKDGNVLEWYVQSDKELKELQYLVQKMYNYVLYAYDKSVFKDEKMTEKQENILKDKENGIKSYQDYRKRGAKTYYKEPKWAVIDDEILKKNNEKVENFNKNNGKIIEEQEKNYQKLKFLVSNLSRELLDKSGINKKSFIDNVGNDLKICSEAKENINRVYIKEGNRSRHDMLKDVDIQYDKKMIRFVLNNWNLIKVSAQKHPNDYIHAIYMDFDKVIDEIELTVKQNNVLINVMSCIPLSKGEYSSFDMIIEKFYKILNKK